MILNLANLSTSQPDIIPDVDSGMYLKKINKPTDEGLLDRLVIIHPTIAKSMYLDKNINMLDKEKFI